MVLKAMFSSSLDHEEEEMYLRKCNVRKTKRMNEKNRKLAQQAMESMERVPSPSPLKLTTPGQKTKEKVRTPHFDPPSPRSTDDRYPAPSPPPQSPMFASPAFGRTLALSLTLRSPAGFVISGGRKTLSTRYSPEPNVLDFQSVERTISNDSLGGGLDGLTLSSPRGKDFEVSPCTSPLSPEGLQHATGREIGATSIKDAEGSANKESNRVKQFLCHRDRDRTRKAQLLYSAAYGSTDHLDHLDCCGDLRTPVPLQHRGAPSSSSSKNGQRSAAASRGHSAGRYSAEQYVRIDLETDIRAGTSGLIFTPGSGGSKSAHSPRSPRSQRKGPNSGGITTSPRSPQTRSAPIAMLPTPHIVGAGVRAEEGAISPFGSNSPYYRALTLGVSSPQIIPARGPPTAAVQQLVQARDSSSRSSSGNGPLSTTPPYPEQEEDSAEDSAAAYDMLFPALPVVRAIAAPRSDLQGLTRAVDTVRVETEPAPALPAEPSLPVFTAQEICSMLHSALCRAHQKNCPSAQKTDAARAVRAWDDADSDSDDDARSSSASEISDTSSVDSVAAVIITTMQQQVLKLADIDATCAGLMAKCDYIYDILRSPVTGSFDAQWLTTMVISSIRPAGTVRGAFAVTMDTADLNVQALFALGYVHAGLLSHLVQGLQYEDQRFESARLPLLSALYTADNANANSEDAKVITEGCCLRRKITSALEYVCYERHQRCTQLASLATALEVDVNYISKVGYSDLCTSDYCVDSATRSCLSTGCDLTAIIAGENERPAYKTRDSESGLLELLKFIIAREVNAALLQMQAQEAGARMWSEETKTSASSASGSSISPAASFQATSRTLLTRLASAYCYLFQCYTHKLGACGSSASENVEQPAFLEQLLQCLDGLLAWAKILCNLPIGTAPSVPSALDDVCLQILRSTAKHWTAQLNFGQDVAYTMQSEIVLTIYAPAATLEAGERIRSYAALYKNNQSRILPPLAAVSSAAMNAQSVAAQVLKRLLQRVTSAHPKVATQAIQSLQNPVIMVRYFLPRMTTAMVSYIFGTEVGRVTFLSGEGWDNGQREECLNLLVDRLRDCREIHCGPSAASQQLQASSAQLLDTTLELLQLIEDSE